MTYEQEKKLIRATYQDSFYQALLDQCAKFSEDYLRIKNSLSSKDQELLDSYICICEELEHRRTMLAYALGTQEGVQTGVAQLFVD